MYRLKDCTGKTMKGSFYSEEQDKVEGNPENTVRMKNILDEKTENGIKYVKVLWKGYPKQCTEWVR